MPAQCYQGTSDSVRKEGIWYLTRDGEFRHAKNPTHLTYLRKQGIVTADVKVIPDADFLALAEYEGSGR